MSPPGASMSESESARGRPVTAKAVRMDIDFSKVGQDETPKPKPPQRAPATAFTVNFDSASEEVSLQDAARKSAQARRILNRRSGGAGAAHRNAPGELPPSNPSNKRYLLNKLLHGEGQNSEEAGAAESTEVEDRKEADVSSEAGTYVVDVSKRVGGGPASQLMAAKIVEDSDSSSDTSSTESDSGSECEEEPQTTARHVPSPPKPTPPTQPTSPRPSEPEVKKPVEKSDLAKELTKLRAMAGIRPTTSPAAQQQVTRPAGLYDHSRPGPATPPQQPPRPTTGRASLGAQPTNRNCLAASRGGGTAGSTASGPFRRGDGGRYSMRGANAQGVAPSSPQQNAKRPPFRAGVAPMRPGFANFQFGNPEKQKEQEMNAWLRRKDYNPMKAAAEARRAKELKAR
ncbi:hypothetical protein OESDEN_12343 [Oesophagostomum dentatum]|uniref:Uncharacterized protein n=1 Tax=Oesophagostomum dentatum TaxID=61180 RepID=A0A0B1SWG8_OESDE|nr:hypothetical protein OESDEN_12343 [Oesophagostomum dentatum]